jgi:transposase
MVAEGLAAGGEANLFRGLLEQQVHPGKDTRLHGAASAAFDHTCDNSKMRTAYRCRAYPDPAQQPVLARTFGCVRVVWNRTLAARQARWRLEGAGTSYAETDRALTVMKRDPELAFLTEVSSVPLQQALRHQHQAFTAFFAGRARYPRFKSRRSRQSAHCTRPAFTLRGWGEFRRQHAYKCERYGRELVVIDRWYPSSRTCSGCGHLLADLSLSTRHWRCPSCGARHDRDVNAAKNILAAGRAVARGSPGDACGAEVRHSGSSRVHSAANQEPRPVTAGIPVPPGGE